MFLQLAQLAAQLLAQIRVANAGRGLGVHVVQTRATPLQRKLGGGGGGVAPPAKVAKALCAGDRTRELATPRGSLRAGQVV